MSDLFDGKVAEQPEQKDIDAREKEAERRMQAKIPPGYMDKRPGDFLIWTEMKEKAKAANLPILFVTDDRKEDWWLEQSGKTIGPRPELRQEFAAETSQMFYAYPPARFLSLLGERKQNLVSPRTVKEMEILSQLSPRLAVRGDLIGEVEDLAQSAWTDPVKILSLAHQLSEEYTVAARAEVTGAGPALARARARLDDLHGEARRLFETETIDGNTVVDGTDWDKFTNLVRALSRDEVAREVPAAVEVIKRRRRKRAKF